MADVLHRPITTQNYTHGIAIVNPGGTKLGSLGSGVILHGNEPFIQTIDIVESSASGTVRTKLTGRFDDPGYYTA